MTVSELKGQKFNRLTVIDRGTSTMSGIARWLCLCDCGKTKEVVGNNLLNGRSKSCGCLRSELLGIQLDWHKKSLSLEYKIWASMIQRCTNPNHKKYNNYGGRGISVCERWKDFRNFFEDMGRKDSPIHTLDRKDVNGDYEPNNCKWSTPLEQGNNKRNNIILELNGETGTIRHFCDKYGLGYVKIYARVNRGADPIEALTAIYKNGTNKIIGYRQLK